MKKRSRPHSTAVRYLTISRNEITTFHGSHRCLTPFEFSTAFATLVCTPTQPFNCPDTKRSSECARRTSWEATEGANYEQKQISPGRRRLDCEPAARNCAGGIRAVHQYTDHLEPESEHFASFCSEWLEDDVQRSGDQSRRRRFHDSRS